MLTHELRVLIKKEWRQLLRSRSALLTALLLPVLLLVVVPSILLLGPSTIPAEDMRGMPAGVPLPPALRAIGDDPTALLRVLLLPLLVTLSGLIVPSVSAAYTLIAERESHTLELLVALPVRVGQILLAKLVVLFLLAAAVMLTLLMLDAVLLLALGVATLGYVVLLVVLLLAALAYSTASALLLSLLARDFRTANNISAALLVPTIALTVGVLMFAPVVTVGLGLLAALFVLAAAGVTVIALRVVTFERLLR